MTLDGGAIRRDRGRFQRTQLERADPVSQVLSDPPSGWMERPREMSEEGSMSLLYETASVPH